MHPEKWSLRRTHLGTGKSGQALGRTPARVEAGGGAIAQRPAQPAGTSGRSRDDGPELRRRILPPVNELVDANEHLPASRGRTILSRVKAGDVGRALNGSRTRADDPVAVALFPACAERRPGTHNGDKKSVVPGQRIT